MQPNRITKQAVIAAILAWPSLYESQSGRKFFGWTVSGMPQRLREEGWRRVNMGKRDFENLGLEIVVARYIGGVRPKRCWYVIVARDSKAA